MEKKLDSNYTRMLRVILNKFWMEHPTKQQLYGHLPPITKSIKVRRTRYAGHCWRNRDELISDILLWTPSRGGAKSGQPARTYIQQLRADTGYSLENLPGAMDDRDGLWESVREICAAAAAAAADDDDLTDRWDPRTITTGQTESGINNDEEVLHTPQSSRTEASLSDGLMSYTGHLLGGILLLYKWAFGVFYSPSRFFLVYCHQIFPRWSKKV